MVIVLLGSSVAPTPAVARRLAEQLGWKVREVGRGDAVRSIIAAALDRRESIVLTWPGVGLTPAIEALAGLRHVRFVELQPTPTPVPFQALAIDAAADIDVIVGRVRLEFGV